MIIRQNSLNLLILHASDCCDYSMFWKRFLSKGAEGCTFLIHNTSSKSYVDAILSNCALYKYEWVLDKKDHCEFVSVFYKKVSTYNPQMTKGKAYKIVRPANSTANIAPALSKVHTTICDGDRYPFSVIQNKINDDYFVRTYSNLEDKILIVNERENSFKCKRLTHSKELKSGK